MSVRARDIGRAPELGAHARRSDRLVAAVQELSLARDVARVQEIVRTAARDLVDADGATFVLRDDDQCFYADEDAISPLWKGLRFPISACISGWSMLNRQPVAIPDIYQDDRIPHAAYRPTFVQSLVMVPIRQTDPIGAIGTYWATTHHATPRELELLQALADSTALAMESSIVWEHLEARVMSRTRQLHDLTERLSAEVEASRNTEREALRLSMHDELTGLYNRRGLRHMAQTVLSGRPRTGPPAAMLYIDVNGLKETNDTLGHSAGSDLLIATAEVLRRCFRDGDVIGRIGGDEFAVLLPQCVDGIDQVETRLGIEIDWINATGRLPRSLSLSLGLCTTDGFGDDVDTLLHRADLDMYARRGTRDRTAR
mgnify:CR=1 FL=1